MRKEEKGALILEATIVFPVMFFILLFLIYHDCSITLYIKVQ